MKRGVAGIYKAEWEGDWEVRGVLTFPGTSIAPPITTTSFALRNVSESMDAAIARLVNGPTATIVMVSFSFSRRSRSISSAAERLEGVKRA
jgi:hypothetical protein